MTAPIGEIDPHQIWFVVRDGVRAARLERPRFANMFWFSFEVTAMPEARQPVYCAEFWHGTFEVENEWGARVANVWAGTVQPRAPGERVWLRGFRPYRIELHELPRSWRTRAWSRVRRLLGRAARA